MNRSEKSRALFGRSLPFAVMLGTVCCSVAATSSPGGGHRPAGAPSGDDAGSSACATCDGSAGGLVLRGGSVVDPGSKTIEVRDLYICDGRVVSESDGRQCAPMKEVDVSGKWLIPGLTDVHIHARGLSLG